MSMSSSFNLVRMSVTFPNHFLDKFTKYGPTFVATAGTKVICTVCWINQVSEYMVEGTVNESEALFSFFSLSCCRSQAGENSPLSLLYSF